MAAYLRSFGDIVEELGESILPPTACRKTRSISDFLIVFNEEIVNYKCNTWTQLDRGVLRINQYPKISNSQNIIEGCIVACYTAVCLLDLCGIL